MRLKALARNCDQKQEFTPNDCSAKAACILSSFGNGMRRSKCGLARRAYRMWPRLNPLIFDRYSAPRVECSLG